MQQDNIQQTASSVQQPMQNTQIPVSSDEIYATQLQEERIRNVIEQISPDRQLMELQWRLRGYVRDPLTGEWIKLNEDAPEISPILVSRYVSFLSSLLSQNVTMSNFSSGEINNLMKVIIEWTTDDLDANSELYGIGNDYQERSRIGHMLLQNTFAVLKRAMNGQEARRTFSTLSLNESTNSNPNNSKQSMKEALNFWKI